MTLATRSKGVAHQYSATLASVDQWKQKRVHRNSSAKHVLRRLAVHGHGPLNGPDEVIAGVGLKIEAAAGGSGGVELMHGVLQPPRTESNYGGPCSSGAKQRNRTPATNTHANRREEMSRIELTNYACSAETDL